MQIDVAIPPRIGVRPVHNSPAGAAAGYTGRSVVAVGTFDGVHIGHQAILARGRAIADRTNKTLIALTFHPHPKSVVSPDRAPLLLTEPEEKAALLYAYGADHVVQLEFNSALAATKAGDFLNRVILDGLRAETVVFGDDFRLGHGREGTPDFVSDWGRASGVQVEMVKQVTAISIGRRVSSTLIRSLIKGGEFSDAVDLLGHAYPVSGQVVKGEGRGRKIGYPTWNIALSDIKLAPPVGIYAGWAGRATPRPAMSYYGSNPTFGGYQKRLEANLIDAGRDAAPEVEETIWLGAYVREEIRFEGADALVRQLAEDERIVRDMLSMPVHDETAS